ncbi:hypothetical protein [Methylobacterium gnaphalii]|uniref:hypothetical protein n=1 Tax=Methylobacterium gnaphalii TaxID=1010610 RepID=UPI0011BFD038|nr:hypothetical protein [Methylobacterium gnaphalii]GJD68367.1 hypothetical protein MMMDOFMJ_1290 [Methylobacterium gnaphalii]
MTFPASSSLAKVPLSVSEPSKSNMNRQRRLVFGIPRLFVGLLAFIVIGIVLLVSVFMGTKPTQDQRKSPHDQSREQVQLPR